jgi:hypothetical protein
MTGSAQVIRVATLNSPITEMENVLHHLLHCYGTDLNVL